MTSRPRTTPARSRTWDLRERRSLLLNLGFGLTIVAALLLLVLAAGVSWYSENLASAATVNGTTITRDAWRRQVEINQFRADYQLRRIRTLLAAGHIGASDAEARQAVINQRLAQVDALSLEQLVDGRLQADLAAQQGVAVTEADIDARFTEEATTPELRHAWVIEVEPVLAEGETVPSAAAIAAARTAAEGALADLRAGEDWEAVAKAVSTADSAEQAGDLGFVDENTALEAGIREALLEVAEDTPTEIVAGSDDVFRIGRVTEIVPPTVDGTLAAQVEEYGIEPADFRAALGRDVTRTKLNDAIVAQYLAPAPQREVSEIFLQEDPNETMDGAIRVRHILYSPNDDPEGAQTLDEADPAWAEAKADADAAYARLQADPDLFDSIARAESDEGAARTTGGKLGYYADDGSLDEGFADAIFAPGLQPGQLLAPARSSFGWHVIQVMRYPPDLEWAATLRSQIDDGQLSFADAARDNSDTADAADGGRLGWVGRGQLDEEREAAIFAAPIGRTSDALVVDGQGISIFLVSREETREPDAEQRRQIENTAFSIWYSKQKADAEISREALDTGI
jgi:parvulin-like peptidyl-prolyl isomerase